MSEVIYHLRDINTEVVQAWRRAFADIDMVQVSAGNIFDVPADAIVSPANSFGFMDGGIDLAYSLRFGWQLQARLQAKLRAEHDGELPVGLAVVLETNDLELPYLVSAPTMRVPMNVSNTLNAYLAFRATLIAVRDFNRQYPGAIGSVLCPGLGTATGRVDPEICARQMFAAYVQIVGGIGSRPQSVNDIILEHYALLQAPFAKRGT